MLTLVRRDVSKVVQRAVLTALDGHRLVLCTLAVKEVRHGATLLLFEIELRGLAPANMAGDHGLWAAPNELIHAGLAMALARL